MNTIFWLSAVGGGISIVIFQLTVALGFLAKYSDDLSMRAAYNIRGPGY